MFIFSFCRDCCIDKGTAKPSARPSTIEPLKSARIPDPSNKWRTTELAKTISAIPVAQVDQKTLIAMPTPHPTSPIIYTPPSLPNSPYYPQIPGITPGFWIWQPYANVAPPPPLFSSKSTLTEHRIPLNGTINDGPINGSGTPIEGHVIIAANQPDDLTIVVENGYVEHGQDITINRVKCRS